MKEDSEIRKRNVAITILSIVLIVLLALIIWMAFLPSYQYLNPLFRVTYEARAVNAKVVASYREEGSLSNKNMVDNETGEEYIEFDSSDTESVVKTLSMVRGLELEEYKSHYVLFTYTFTNRNRSRYLSVSLKDKAYRKNVLIYYATSGDIPSPSQSFVELVEQVRAVDKHEAEFTIICPKSNSEENKEVVVYALFTVIDEYDNATYETRDNAKLMFTLESFYSA